MGNDLGKPSATAATGEATSTTNTRLAIAAMSTVTAFEKKELTALNKRLRALAEKEPNNANYGAVPDTTTTTQLLLQGRHRTIIGRAAFRQALDDTGIAESDVDILERLFTMLDKTGDDVVDYREFMVGISSMITTPEASEKVAFAFSLYDMDGAGIFKAPDLSFILTSINNVASYFGDPVVTADQIQELVDDVYRDHDTQGRGQIGSSDLVGPVVAHHHFQTFLEGKGTVRYGVSK